MEKSTSLSQKVIRGGAWVFTLNIVARGLFFIRTVILARLLLPSDFGLVGIAMIATSMLLSFSGTGFAPALIQKKSGTADYLNTAWCVEAVRGIVLAFILFLLAPLVAIFFNNPEAKLVIQVMAIAIALTGLTNMGMIYFQKELQFEKLFIYNFSTQMATLIVSVSLAFILRNVWALVYGTIFGAMTKLILSYVFHPFRPNLKFDLDKAKELFRFGKWMLGSSILIFLLTQGDDIFVGKLLGVTALGFYTMAYRLSNLPTTEITHVISQVTFPAYSKLQDNIPKLRESYLKVLQVTVFLSFPLAGLIFILAPEFTRIFLGEKWIPMVPAMQALAFFGITRAINATTGPVFQGIGKPKINTVGSMFQLVVFIAIIFPLTHRWGILGTSIAVIIPNILFMIYIVKKLESTMNYKLVNFIAFLLPPIIGSITMCFVLSLVYIWDNITLFGFLLSIILAISIYLIVMYNIDKFSNYGLKNNLSQLFLRMWGHGKE